MYKDPGRPACRLQAGFSSDGALDGEASKGVNKKEGTIYGRVAAYLESKASWTEGRLSRPT